MARWSKVKPICFRPFPPPALPGFIGTTSLSATPRRPTPPSRVFGWLFLYHAKGLPVLPAFSLCTCYRHYPGTAPVEYNFAHFHSLISLPRKGGRVGLCNGLFEDCSAFTHVISCTFSGSPKSDPLHQRLHLFRYLHNCSDCFRLERPSPGGTFTHWKTPP